MIRRSILVGLLAIASLGVAAAPVAAKSGAIITHGQCSGSSVWKLKLSPEDSGIEVEFQVDQNRNNRVWGVSLTHNGTRVWRGSRRTSAPSGSFTIRRILANHTGTDRILARATNAATGEVCRASATAS